MFLQISILAAIDILLVKAMSRETVLKRYLNVVKNDYDIGTVFDQTLNYENYTVKKNDTLWSIASAMLGNGSRYHEIKKINGLVSDAIYTGQILKIPK